MAFEPSVAQKAAIESRARRVLIAAGPGAGKSATLVARGQYLLKERLVSDADEILILTFTVKAAEEIRGRFDGHVLSSTFHALCFQLLHEYGDRITDISNVLVPPFTVMDDVDQVVLMQECLDDLRWSMSANKLVKWYNLGEPPGHEPAYAPGMTAGDLETVLHDYEQRKADSNAVDFRGLVTTLLRILVLDPDYLLFLRSRWSFIACDEFQDVNSLAMCLVRLLIRDDTFVVACGDVDQCIFSFAYADPRLMLGKLVPVIGLPKEVAERNVVSLGGWGNLQDTQSWEIHHLGDNFRSDIEIVDASRRLIGHNRDRHEIPLAPVSDIPGYVYGYEYDVEEENERFMALVKHAKSFEGTLAILTRTNDTATHIARLLREDGTYEHYLIGEETDMWESHHAKRLLYVLRAASNRFDRWTALRVIQELQKGVDGALVAHMREMSAVDGRAMLDVAAVEIPAITDKLDLIREVQRMPEEPGKILAAMDMAKAILPWTAVHERIEAYAEAWARGGQGLAAFLFFASYHKEAFREKVEIEPGTIWVSNTHVIKGQERDGVIVIAERGEFPAGRKQDDEEERRVFYVAITRPKHRLFLAYANSRLRFGRMRHAGPSQYLAEMWPGGIPKLSLASAEI